MQLIKDLQHDFLKMRGGVKGHWELFRKFIRFGIVTRPEGVSFWFLVLERASRAPSFSKSPLGYKSPLSYVEEISYSKSRMKSEIVFLLNGDQGAASVL